MKIPILDHGYIELIESWGSDQAIIEAARMSTNKSFLGWESGICPTCKGKGQINTGPGDYGDEYILCKSCEGKGNIKGDKFLLKYLWDNKHSTPFEMAGLTIEVQAPIMCFREWHRHRVPFGYSEASARYTPLPDVNYVPTIERLMISSKTNKQAGTIKGADELTENNAFLFQEKLKQMWEDQENLYQWALKSGIPKELARTHIGVGRYSKMRATGNLRGWLAFLTLRMAPGAQFEIRMFANVLGDIIKEKFPRTWELFSAKKE